MKQFFSKKILVIAAMAILLCVTVGSTLAYILTNTEPLVNKFEPAKVSCAVVENDGDPVSGGIFYTGDTKENVKIQNTGNTDAYIRVTVVAKWVSADGTRVWAQKPLENADYTITLSENSDWVSGADGFWYYRKAVAPGEATPVLITEAVLNSGVAAPQGADGTDYYLSLEIVASAVQARPDTAVEGAWTSDAVSIDSVDGTLTVTNKGG